MQLQECILLPLGNEEKELFGASLSDLHCSFSCVKKWGNSVCFKMNIGDLALYNIYYNKTTVTNET